MKVFALAMIVALVAATTWAQDDFELEEERGGVKCKVCKFIVKKVQQLGTGHTQQQAEALLDIACDRLGFLSSVCKKFVHKELTKLWHHIFNGTPEQVCQHDHFC